MRIFKWILNDHNSFETSTIRKKSTLKTQKYRGIDAHNHYGTQISVHCEFYHAIAYTLTFTTKMTVTNVYTANRSVR